MHLQDIVIAPPGWLAEVADVERSYPTDADRMRVAIDAARRNVTEAAGGPFGAAIFERGSGRLVSVGVNSVVRLSNSALHAEMVAFMAAEAALGTYTLRLDDGRAHELFTSCEPCAMCLGALLWSGVTRVAYGATRDDARKLGFEEGPVFPESWAYVAARGIAVERELCRAEAVEVLDLYRSRGGRIYNG